MSALKSIYNRCRKAIRLARLLRLIRSLETNGYSGRSLEEGMKRNKALDEARRQYLREKFPQFKG